MRSHLLVVGTLVAFTAAGAVPVDRLPDLGARTKRVDSFAVEELGLRIRDIALLLQAGPTRFRPKVYEERVGNLETAQKLEASGYIKIETTKGLPDGYEKTTEFVAYVPTKSGQDVIDALK